MSEQKYRDSLFRNYFSEKEHLLSLVNALLGTDVADTDEIEINTIDGAFSTDIRNDVSCIFRNRFLVLIEQQSMPNNNMPARMLFYLTELMRKYADMIDFHRHKLIEFPEPEFFVLYNGQRSGGKQSEMRLSEAFHNSKNIELVVKFIDVREGHNVDLIKQSKHLANYCAFVNRVMHNRKCGMQLSAAIQEAQNYCIEHDFMAEYLRKHYWEVAKMYIIEYDREAAVADARELGYEEGREEGREKGREQERFAMVERLLKAGMSIEFIANVTELSEAQIRAAGNKNMQ